MSKINNSFFIVIHKFIILLCLILASPVSVSAYDFTSAMSAYEAGDFHTAFEQFTQLALNDNSEAQYNLAFMYFGGEGISQDDVKAAYWFEQAAKAGHAAAQDTLGYMYLNGRGLEKDRVRAFVWYNLAADNGIFLAKDISEKLREQMGNAERAYADSLSYEYLKKYKKK